MYKINNYVTIFFYVSNVFSTLELFGRRSITLIKSMYSTPWGILLTSDQIIGIAILNFKVMIVHFFS